MTPSGIDIDIRINERSVLEQVRKVEKVFEDMSKGVVTDFKVAEKAVDDFSKSITALNNRQEQNTERNLKNLEREAAAYARSPVDRLIARQEFLTQKYKGNEEAIKRVNVAMEEMIRKEKERAGGNLAEVAAQAKDAKNAMALLGMEFGVHIPRQLRGFLAELPGVGAAMSAAFSAVAVVGILEVIGRVVEGVMKLQKELRDMEQAALRARLAFRQMNEEIEITILEQQVVNDKLENSIAKLEHKPEDGFAQAIDDANLAAMKLDKTMGDILDKLLTVLKDQTKMSWVEEWIQKPMGLLVAPPEFDEEIAHLKQMKGTGVFFEEAKQRVIDQREAEAHNLAFWRAAQLGDPFEGKTGEEMTGFWRRAKGPRTGMPGDVTDTRGMTLPPGITPIHGEIIRQQDIDARYAEIEYIEKSTDLQTKITKGSKDQAKNDILNAQKAGLKDLNEALAYTNRLREELAKAQEKELYGMDKINAAHTERIRLLREEEKEHPAILRNHRQNIAIIDQIQAANIEAFNQKQAQMRAATRDETQRSRDESAIRSSYAIFQAKRKAAGEEYSEVDIQAEYRNQVVLATMAYRDEMGRIEEMKKAKMDAATIEEAQAKAQRELERRIAEDRTKATTEQSALEAKRDDQAKNAAQAAKDRERQLDQAVFSEGRRRKRDMLHRQIEMLQAEGLKSGRPGTLAGIEGLRIQEAGMGRAETQQQLAEQKILVEETYRVSKQQTADKEKRAIDLNKLEIEGVKAQGEYQRQIDDAHWDSTVKLMEMQKQQTEEIAKTLEPLFETLFTHPGKFGSQLGQTVRQATMRPIIGGLSETAAQLMRPTIFGAEGTGGIAGMLHGMFGGFHGKLADVKLTSEGSVPVHVTGVSAGGAGGVGGGGGGPLSAFAPHLFGGGGGGALATLFGSGGGTIGGGVLRSGISLPTGLLYGGGGGGATAPAESGTGYYGAGSIFPGFGTASIASPGGGGSMGYSGGGGGGGLIGGILRGFGQPAGGGGGLIGGILRGFGRPAGGGGGGGGGGMIGADGLPVSPVKLPPGLVELATGGKLAGALTSKAAGQAELSTGLMLGMAGLAGQRRGTAGGFFESMGGGALTGAGIGTMIMPGVGTAIGAGIGAAAGALAGGLEVLTGAESPRHEAIRLVQQVYGIHIDNGVADQIVAMAKQSYAGHVSLAVRSPEVRHMLGLYAAGTGQGSLFKQSANEAHGASLVESGGRMYQQATYQYGQGYSYSSNLPVYGGASTTQLANPGGNMPLSLSLNVGGQDAARFMTGQVVTPDVVSTQYANAMYASNGRVNQALMLNEPGTISG
jgi:hypothetical protein